MSILKAIHDEAGRQQLRFLVIGGLAVNYYGYSRETADLDIFVCQDDRGSWLGILFSLGYTVFNDGGNFIQLSAPSQNAWPVDLMLVQLKTFEPMFQASREVDFYGTRSRVPAVEHLLALKLHALKNGRMHRFLKDFMDVQNLILINRLDVNSENIRNLFIKYGTPELYEKISRSIAAS